MKRRMLQIMRTNKRRAGSAGSLTLEAALTMPLVMLCILFLIYLIHASIAAMALQGALSQTARQAAAVWYPLSESIDEAQEATGSASGSAWKGRLAGTQETVGRIAPFLPEPLSAWAGRFADGSWYPDAIAAKLALEPRVAERLRKTMLPPSRMELVKVVLPDAEDRAMAYLALEAEYRLPFSYPWSGSPLVLRASVRERVWTGGERLPAAAPEEGLEPGSLSFVSLAPDPVQRGRRVTLVVRAEPGVSVDLKVFYKSGLSQARHLGAATADAAGLVSWTWLVSGSTTPGEWAWVASHAGESLQQTFQVIAKEAGKGGRS